MGMAQMIFDAVNGFEAPRALIDVAIEPPNLEIMLVNQVEFHFSTVHGAERTFRHIANPPLFMQWMIHRSVLQQIPSLLSTVPATIDPTKVPSNINIMLVCFVTPQVIFDFRSVRAKFTKVPNDVNRMLRGEMFGIVIFTVTTVRTLLTLKPKRCAQIIVLAACFPSFRVAAI